MTYEDPGWKAAVGGVWRAFVPGLNARRAAVRRASGERVDGLVVLRGVVVNLAAGLGLFGFLVVVLDRAGSASADRQPGLALLLTIVGASLPMGARAFERALDGSSPIQLGNSYRVRFFLRIAGSESAALVGFVAFLATHEWWTYPVGAAVAAVGFRRAAPSRPNLAADQAALAEHGCRIDLAAALGRGA